MFAQKLLDAGFCVERHSAHGGDDSGIAGGIGTHGGPEKHFGVQRACGRLRVEGGRRDCAVCFARVSRANPVPVVWRARRKSGRVEAAGDDCREGKEIRRAESTRAAGILGAEIRFFDSGDYPIVTSQETIQAIVEEYRDLQPEFVLTHSLKDPYNPDHETANRVSQKRASTRRRWAIRRMASRLNAPPVFIFEPHQPEQCEFLPQVLARRDGRMGRQAQGHGIDGSAGASVAVLHGPRQAARYSGRAQRRAEDIKYAGGFPARVSRGDFANLS